MTNLNDEQSQSIIRKRQENIGNLFKQASRDFNDRALLKLRERGYQELTLFHTALISNLDIEGTRISTLADRANMSKQAMGQIVNDLETRGYISRSTDPDDKRAYIIQFTDKGWQFLQDAYAVKNEIEAEYSAMLGKAGMETLMDLLNRLIQATDG